MTPDTDIAILGAGCAGLSLAAALGEGRVPGQISLLEPREHYTRDRTWCFWDTEDHPFQRSVSHSWSSWRVSSGVRRVLRRSDRYRYCYLAGDRFYDTALDLVSRDRNQKLCTGVTVHSVEPHPSGLLAVETSSGRLLARRVFDSRPAPQAAPTRTGLIQRFLGRHVRTAGPAFLANIVELMSFLPSTVAGRTRFVYVLPFSVDEALIEMTYLDEAHLAEPPYAADLQAWIEENIEGGLSACTLLHEERGALPMTTYAAPDTLGGRLLPIGIRGGRLKPSSGYGFLRIQRHSRAIADALRSGTPLPTAAESRLYPLMDAVFLKTLQRSSLPAEELFLRLFEKSDPDALVRFLSEASSPAEILRVAWSLPKATMLRSALATFSAGRPREARA
jgi:lycopene beta-cyclase